MQLFNYLLCWSGKVSVWYIHLWKLYLIFSIFCFVKNLTKTLWNAKLPHPYPFNSPVENPVYCIYVFSFSNIIFKCSYHNKITVHSVAKSWTQLKWLSNTHRHHKKTRGNISCFSFLFFFIITCLWVWLFVTQTLHNMGEKLDFIT